MQAYITSYASVTPQKISDAPGFLDAVQPLSGRMIQCSEPEYRELLNPLFLRKMPRMLKIGLYTAMACMKRSGTIPDAIITGTGFGSIGELEKFLAQIIENEEKNLSPLPFINSSHNLVASQFSLMQKIHGYNMTYIQRGVSLTNALTDALLLLTEKEANNILVGTTDEITEYHLRISSYQGDVKEHAENSLKLLEQKTPGTIMGEGCSFFMLSNQKENAKGILKNFGSFYKPKSVKETAQKISALCDISSIDAVILGVNGDNRHDGIYHEVMNELNCADKPLISYKNICGEYHTSNAFALHLALLLLEHQAIPDIIKINKTEVSSIKNILIYDQYKNENHSVMVVGRGLD